jgi:hypothetical protein
MSFRFRAFVAYLHMVGRCLQGWFIPKSRSGRALSADDNPSSKSASCKLERLSNQPKDVEMSEEFSSDENQCKNRQCDLRLLAPDAFS